jgi:hyaluronoglucosaminidase
LVIESRPDFRWRGVIEGFYGHPWTHAQRMRGVEYFADFGMNLFLLAPKDAAWQRLRWREPLSPAFIGEIQQLVDIGRLHGVDVSACVSPGLSVQYSSADDVDAVVARFAQLAAVGATHFGLLLDDIPDTLSNEADIACYPSIAHAHADFANRVRRSMVERMPSAHVILCPMHYAGRGDEPYLQVMGDQLHPQIELMWTGREICSAYLDISDAVVFDRTTRRPPFYWDNYPVNDGSMARRLHIGPFHGREAGLHRYSAGLLANPMELFEASLIPLGTVGAYLWDTTSYEPFAAWDQVLADLVPDIDDRSALREFFRNALGFTGAWAPAFNGFLDACATAWRGGRPAEAAEATRAMQATIEGALACIERDTFSAPLLRDELRPWLRKYRLGAELLAEFAAVLDACTPNDDGSLSAPVASRAVVNDLRSRFNTDPQLLFGDGFDMMLFTFTVEVVFA